MRNFFPTLKYLGYEKYITFFIYYILNLRMLPTVTFLRLCIPIADYSSWVDIHCNHSRLFQRSQKRYHLLKWNLHRLVLWYISQNYIPLKQTKGSKGIMHIPLNVVVAAGKHNLQEIENGSKKEWLVNGCVPCAMEKSFFSLWSIVTAIYM